MRTDLCSHCGSWARGERLPLYDRKALTSVALAVFSTGPASGQQVTTAYRYDDLGRLTHSFRADSNIAYGFDANANRQAVTSTSGTSVVLGTEAGDVTLGTGGSDRIYMLGGDDFIGGGGYFPDWIDGGPGQDWVFFDSPSDASFSYQPDGSYAATNVPTGVVHTLVDVEGVVFFNTLQLFPIPYLLAPHAVVNGTSGSDLLGGGVGVVKVNGLSGDDFFGGGSGANVFDGGDGGDTAVYGYPRNEYQFIQTHIGSNPAGAVQAKHVPSGFIDILISTEYVFFLSSNEWIAIQEVLP
jgi:YD repeat-containing protein